MAVAGLLQLMRLQARRVAGICAHTCTARLQPAVHRHARTHVQRVLAVLTAQLTQRPQARCQAIGCSQAGARRWQPHAAAAGVKARGRCRGGAPERTDGSVCARCWLCMHACERAGMSVVCIVHVLACANSRMGLHAAACGSGPVQNPTCLPLSAGPPLRAGAQLPPWRSRVRPARTAGRGGQRRRPPRAGTGRATSGVGAARSHAAAAAAPVARHTVSPRLKYVKSASARAF